MKFSISLWLLILTTTAATAAPIKIFYEEESLRAGWVKDIFVTTYQIPEDLIELKKVDSCGRLKDKGKLDLCLNNNGDLLVVSVDRGFIFESLTIFRTP